MKSMTRARTRPVVRIALPSSMRNMVIHPKELLGRESVAQAPNSETKDTPTVVATTTAKLQDDGYTADSKARKQKLFGLDSD